METETTPTPTAVTAKRKRRASAPRAKKTLDPGIAAIREKMALEVAQYRSAQASAKLLKTITEKRLPKLTPEDRQKLFDELGKTETLELLPRPAAQPNPDSLERAHRYAETLAVKTE